MASSIIQTPEMALLSRVEAALAEVKQQVDFFRNALGDANEDQQTMT